MFGPLSFPSPMIDSKNVPFQSESIISACFLCEAKYNLTLQQEDFLQHIFDSHKLVIADVPLIASLQK